MDDTKELIDARTVRLAMMAIGVGGPILGAAAGAVVGAIRRVPSAYLMRGFGVGLLGSVCYLMWLIYNAVIRRLGLDSVAALLLNLGIFVVVGIAIGILLALVTSRRRPARTGG